MRAGKKGLATLTSEIIQAQMDKKKLSTWDLAGKIGTSYEHARNLQCGRIVPSEYLLPKLAVAIGVNARELTKTVVSDRIRMNYGAIPLELAGKDPELEPIERAWRHLSDAHKADIILIAQSFAECDRGAPKTLSVRRGASKGHPLIIR